ncbi:MAG: hypothetical protein OIF50_09505 [Flavobacteriaceae bacterium]|nr:hypothetical protein [Flavobacteriaceae bacterium]
MKKSFLLIASLVIAACSTKEEIGISPQIALKVQSVTHNFRPFGLAVC